MPSLASLLTEVRACTLWALQLPHGPHLIVQAHGAARILIVGQAPGRKVHETGIPFNDASGERMRDWLGIPREVFYDARRIALMPMGFCYPGKGKSGDLPPRPECAPRWRSALLGRLTDVRLTLVVGQYALAYHLPEARLGVTQAVLDWERYWPDVVPLPHPSPTNNGWFSKNRWFELDLVPRLRARVAEIAATTICRSQSPAG